MESFVFEQLVLFKVEYLYLSLSMISDLKVLLAQGGARSQNPEYLIFSVCITSFMEAVVDELVTIFSWLSFFIYHLSLNFSLTGLELSMLIGGGEG